jgi:hypothetical protein
MATFVKGIVRQRLSESAADEAVDQLAESAEFYLSLRREYTHCYSCKRSLNSIDFDLCRKCNWIRCTCGACRCGYQGRSRLT